MKIISPRFFWVPVMLTALVATFFATLMARGAHRHVELLREQTRLEYRLAQLQAQNRQLRIERTELLTDLGAVERAAREELNLVAPGENVVVAHEVPPPPVPAPPPPELGPIERAAVMPHFAERVLLASLAGSAVLFLLWNTAAAVWSKLRATRPGGEASPRQLSIAPAPDGPAEHRDAA